jgi:hypothetical protein
MDRQQTAFGTRQIVSKHSAAFSGVKRLVPAEAKAKKAMSMVMTLMAVRLVSFVNYRWMLAVLFLPWR